MLLVLDLVGEVSKLAGANDDDNDNDNVFTGTVYTLYRTGNQLTTDKFSEGAPTLLIYAGHLPPPCP